MSKAQEFLNELKQLQEMARIGEDGLYSFWVYTEPLKNPSFHLKHKTDFEIVLQAKDLTILEIKHNDSRFKFKKGDSLPGELQKLTTNFLKSKNKFNAKITNLEMFQALWSSINECIEDEIEFMKATDLLEKLNFDEMSNLPQKDTGLPVVIWVSSKGATNHGPRIKVNASYSKNLSPFNLFSITIEDEPKVVGKPGEIKNKDLKKIVEWVKLNKEVLMKYWDYKIGTIDLANELKKI